MKTVSCEGETFTPSKIVCVGRNYAAHAREMGSEVPQRPVFFIKPNSSITDTLSSANREPLHYEAELCFLIKDNVIYGVGLGLDLTKRALQRQLKAEGLPWERSKAFDGSAVFTPFKRLQSHDVQKDLALILEADGKILQRGSLQQMIFRPDELLDYCLQDFSLADGDVLMTGTPEGVGAIEAGKTYTLKLTQSESTILEKSWRAL